jgi:indolepyruvate ferredoxin oxidoreductase
MRNNSLFTGDATGSRVIDFSLDDKYLLEDGTVFVTGVQALVRVLLDHRRRDRRAGHRTGTFVSGYPGSPLGGFDVELGRALRLAGDEDVVHVPGLNEDLSATAVWGSQRASALPGARRDGVLGVWYGKSPGIDRSGDAIRHANTAGTGPLSGAVAFVGDDPTGKSSTVPCASESMLAELGLPVFYPGSVQDVVDLGPHAIACSRASGLWTAMKVAVNVADSAGTAVVHPDRVVPIVPTLKVDGRPFSHQTHWKVLAPDSLVLEESLFGARRELARRYAQVNGLNPVTVQSSDDWLGVVAGGKTYYDLREALALLGLANDDLRRMGVRLWKIEMLSPLDPAGLASFVAGLDEVLVFEDKRPFLEDQVKQLLFNTQYRPLVVGKADESGDQLLSPVGELTPVDIARALVTRLDRRDLAPAPVAERAADLVALAERPTPVTLARTPYFCSGCPHNRSTKAADDVLVGAGVGCHTMVLVTPEGKGHVTGMTQMGGEGAQWVGMSSFTDEQHFVQNVGDGTFFHSASLALRWAVSSGVNITYKLLFNSAIAMTGGQDVKGGQDVPELTRMLEAEGVARIIVTAEEPERYDGVKLPGNVSVRPREGFEDAERELAAIQGVTVLIHDQQCAAEKRRLRKRGRLPTPDRKVVINERVCEGCGDCGVKSGCLSVLPVQTEFGRKTQIHEPSCNKDFTCLDGDCPSFMVIKGGAAAAAPDPGMPLGELPTPVRAVGDDVRIRMPGIGGTGVVTTSQILGVAATLDGRQVSSLDQTGLAQKGGTVVSDIRIYDAGRDGSTKAPAGSVDVYLALDMLSATTAANLEACDPARTVAVVSTSEVPTGDMVTHTDIAFPRVSGLVHRIDRFTRAEDNFFLDAEALALALFGDSMPANTIMLGAAYQRGLLPVSAEALERAFELNGVAVTTTRQAFAWGRAAVCAPDAIEQATRPAAPVPAAPDRRAAALVDGFGFDGALRELAEHRASELLAYQDAAYARSYLAVLARVRAAETERLGAEHDAIALAVARNLHKLMAYKDEYEVARLLLDPQERARAREIGGPGARVVYQLHPPLLRALGLERKIGLGEWFTPAFRVLRRMRRLRGTALDPFGYAEIRRVERRLVVRYREAVEAAIGALAPETAPQVLALSELPDLVRGYEGVKLATVEEFDARLVDLSAQCRAGVTPTKEERE